jgi:two-component system, OmpR family, KDP operon response regulator KdpE
VSAAPPAGRVLVCDDELQILRALKVVLREAGFEVEAVATGQETLDAAAVRPPDAAILDLMLPDGDGVEVCRQLREWSAMPILVLSALGDEDQKVRALEAGADDYVTKPFGSRELVARPARGAAPRGGPGRRRAADRRRRARARPRRARGPPRQAGGPPHADRVRAAAGAGAQPRAPADAPDAAERGLGPRYVDDTRTLRTHIANLRRKVEPEEGAPRYIRTDRGVGYRFGA